MPGAPVITISDLVMLEEKEKIKVICTNMAGELIYDEKLNQDNSIGDLAREIAIRKKVPYIALVYGENKLNPLDHEDIRLNTILP